MPYNFNRDMFKNKGYLKHLEPLIKEACEKSGIDLEEGKELVDEYIILVRNVLEDPRLIPMIIPNLGTMRAELNALRNRIKRTLLYSKKGSVPWYITKGKIKKYWKIYKRKVAERYSRLGGPSIKTEVINYWNNLSPDYLRDLDKVDLKTDLPDSYYDMDHKEWLDFLRQEPRFGLSQVIIQRVVMVYNSLIGRLTYYDKIHFDEDTLPAKGFSIPRGSGRLPIKLEERLPLIFSILTKTYCFDTNTILEEDIYERNKKDRRFYL